MNDMPIEWVETPLSIREQFRLVEIAHETSSLALKEAALKVLHRSLSALMLAGADKALK